jgi:hypothetical protein
MLRASCLAAWVAFSLLPLSKATAAKAVTDVGRVTDVTVYQGQALVTRQVEVAEAEGLLEVVVTNLPEFVLPGSLFAEPEGEVQVRSVRYRVRPVEGDVREEVQELDAQIQETDDQIAAVHQERDLLQQRRDYLNQLGQFAAATGQVELKSGVLNADTLKDLTRFQFDEREAIARRELELAKEERAHNKARDLLVRQRETITAGSSRTVREAVVFINAPQAGAVKLHLSYLVGNASWSPSYNFRATEARDQVTVEYNASIQQMSGEDWNDVAMVLSTATPSLVAKAPKLEALAIKLGTPVPAAAPMSAAENYRMMQSNLKAMGQMRGSAVDSMSDVQQQLAGERVREKSVRGLTSGAGGGLGSWGFAGAPARQADEQLNRAAVELQLMDFNNSFYELRKGITDSTAQSTEGVSVSYSLANRTSLPSRSDRQLIQIASIPLKGTFYRVATPVLTNFCYEEALVTNTSDSVLLAGPAATFLGGQFVGRGEIPTVAVGESFAVGLGIDASLRAGRELVDKQERIQGGNRVVDFTYQLTMENFGTNPSAVRLLDRLPTVGENDIKVTLVKSDQEVSSDQTYLMTDRKNGILRWDLEVPAQAVGPQQKVLRYTMQIEYDKQLSIVGMPAKQ